MYRFIYENIKEEEQENFKNLLKRLDIFFQDELGYKGSQCEEIYNESGEEEFLTDLGLYYTELEHDGRYAWVQFSLNLLEKSLNLDAYIENLETGSNREAEITVEKFKSYEEMADYLDGLTIDDFINTAFDKIWNEEM